MNGSDPCELHRWALPVRIMPVSMVMVVSMVMPVCMVMIVLMLMLQGDLDLFLAAAFTATISRLAGIGDMGIGDKG